LDLAPDFDEFCALLTAHAVEFVIGRDAFLRNKRAAGRPKDLADVEALGDDGH
jgi:hypothetical protein